MILSVKKGEMDIVQRIFERGTSKTKFMADFLYCGIGLGEGSTRGEVGEKGSTDGG